MTHPDRNRARARIIITDPEEVIHVTIYRDGELPVRVEQTALQSLIIAKQLLDAALRRLVRDPCVRTQYL
jgi:hypothetical protein